MEQTISNPKFLLSLIVILLFLTMIAFTFIRYLCKVVAHLKYCSEIAYQHIEQLKKSGCGHLERFDAYGEKVSMPLAPGITDYRKRVQYQTYDVTKLIKENKALYESLKEKSK